MLACLVFSADSSMSAAASWMCRFLFDMLLSTSQCLAVSRSCASTARERVSLKVDRLQQLLHCPQLDDLRNAHSHLFQTPGQTLTDLFDDHPPMLLAKYVRAALLMHQSVLLLP